MKPPTSSARREKDEWLHIQSESVSYNLTEDKGFLSLLAVWQNPSTLHTKHSSVEMTWQAKKRQEAESKWANSTEGSQAVCSVFCCLVHTQLFGASQQVLFIGQDVVEDKKLGGDGVALSSSPTTIPLPWLPYNRDNREAKITAMRKTGKTIRLCITVHVKTDTFKRLISNKQTCNLSHLQI